MARFNVLAVAILGLGLAIAACEDLGSARGGGAGSPDGRVEDFLLSLGESIDGDRLSAELSEDEIITFCKELSEAHGGVYSPQAVCEQAAFLKTRAAGALGTRAACEAETRRCTAETAPSEDDEPSYVGISVCLTVMTKAEDRRTCLATVSELGECILDHLAAADAASVPQRCGMTYESWVAESRRLRYVSPESCRTIGARCQAVEAGGIPLHMGR